MAPLRSMLQRKLHTHSNVDPMRALFTLFLLLNLAACKPTDDLPPPEANEQLSGGTTSVNAQHRDAFSQPARNLTPEQRLQFSVGNSFFRNPWVMAPATTTARDGLGPLFNSNACQNCHIRDGRGRLPTQTNQQPISLLVRLSQPADPQNPQHMQLMRELGNIPDEVYGLQLQDMAVPTVRPEVRIRLSYQSHEEVFRDGTRVTLRKPLLHLDQWGYRAPPQDTQYSLRLAPPMIGLGLLESIPEAAILNGIHSPEKIAWGVQGTANHVWDREQQKTVLGRFGWKAGQPSIAQQNAQAFVSDMGLTSAIFPQDECTATQVNCQQAAHGGEPEVSENIAQHVLFYTRHLGVPQRRNLYDAQVLAGRRLFYQAGCQHCHTPRFVTGAQASEPSLANQVIYPYSDLLLHDMGEGLADQRGEFLANGQQWRTAPLWGLGLTERVSGQVNLLHDGRARSILEAILWHGGEAQKSKDAVLNFNAVERENLLRFLNSL